MGINEWWPMLGPDVQTWLIAHNGEAVSPEVLDKILAVGGPTQQDGEYETDGFFLSDQAVDWIEAIANDESA